MSIIASMNNHGLLTRDYSVVVLSGKADVGASGAVTLSDGVGVTITKEAGDGDYTLTVNNTTGGVPAILFASASVHVASGDVSLNVFMRPADTSAGSVGFTVVTTTTSAPTNPASGDDLSWLVLVRNSTLAR